MTCPYAPMCMTEGMGPARIPTSIEEIKAARKFYEDLEKEIKDKEAKKDKPKKSALQIWLMLGVFAVPAFIVQSIVVLLGVKIIIMMAKSIGG